MDELTLEQKILRYLAQTKMFTRIIDLDAALKDPSFADVLITGNGLSDEIGDTECDHKALSNDEIQEVFDNDNE